MQKREKSNLYSFTIASYRRQTRFIFFHYSSTPILRIQLTSATDKKADNCNLPTDVIYTRYGVDDRKQRSDSIAPEVVEAAKDQLNALISSDDVMAWDKGSHGSTYCGNELQVTHVLSEQ